MNLKIYFKKKEQRNILTKKRFKINQSISLIGNLYYQTLTKYDWFQKANIVASFLSIKTEIPTEKLNNFIENSSKTLCLPVMTLDEKQPLLFKKFNKGDVLKVGNFGVKEPINENSYLPDIIFAPCLAFDMRGFRLGYGGGYYDRTIAYYRSLNHNFSVIGYAYDDQKIDQVIHNNLDQKLDYILTEKQLYKI